MNREAASLFYDSPGVMKKLASFSLPAIKASPTGGGTIGRTCASDCHSRAVIPSLNDDQPQGEFFLAGAYWDQLPVLEAVYPEIPVWLSLAPDDREVLEDCCQGLEALYRTGVLLIVKFCNFFGWSTGGDLPKLREW